MDLKGIDAVLKAMRAFPNNSQLQARACGILCNMSSSTEVSAMLYSSGALELIANAMRSHPDHSEVQYAGCSAMYNMTMDRMCA